MTFADCLKRALGTYRRALLDANAPAVDTSRDIVSNGRGGHGKHGQRSAHLAFAQDLPVAVEMERSFARWCDVWEARLDGADPAQSAPGAKTGKAKRAEDKAIVAAVGMDPTALAFIYRRTTEGVRKLRLRNGLDPDTGERTPRTRMLTEHPRETLKRHESATTTPQESV